MKTGALLFSLLSLCAAGPAWAQGTATETVGFSISIEPVFTVSSSSEEGGNVRLGPVGPGQPPASKTATVSVRSNTGRRYQVLQRIEQELPSQVLFTVTEGVNGGRSEVKAPAPLTTQPAAIFTSDGESDDFTITYSIPPGLIPAGSYRARVLLKEEFR